MPVREQSGLCVMKSRDPGSACAKDTSDETTGHGWKKGCCDGEADAS